MFFSTRKSAHSKLLPRYKQLHEVRLSVNKQLVEAVPKKMLESCARELEFLRNETFVFGSEDEMAILMDYSIYKPQGDGRNVVSNYLAESPPREESDEMVVLRAMTKAYYSLFVVTEVERGVGVAVWDALRGKSGFIVDVGLGQTGAKGLVLASRAIPTENFLTTGGAAIPVGVKAGERIKNLLVQAKRTPGLFDFDAITPAEEAEVALMVIRACLSAGMTSRVHYQEPGIPGQSVTPPIVTPHAARSRKCPCGSGKKYTTCCGRR